MAAARQHAKIARQGVSIRNLHLLMAFIILTISVLLLLATFLAKAGYTRMRENTEDYIQWERDADDLQRASDYLTEQVRCFVVTGERLYLDNYFEEANVTRRRDKALESISGFLGDSAAYRSLQAAMDESIRLMDREYYAMRLAIAAFGLEDEDFPEVVMHAELSEEDALLPPEAQKAVAREKVFDDVYHTRKDAIAANVQACLTTLADEVGGQQKATADRLNDMLRRQRLLIIVSISMMLLTMLLTLGSKEFQFLARTYNLMYEANREQKEHLAFEATHDPLTGIYNRSGYDFLLNNTDWSTSCLLLFDVDKFKQINDTYGHETGDRLLQRVAKAIRDSFRSQDYVCRIGGDEFAVIMVHTDTSQAELVRGKVGRINENLGRDEGDLPGTFVSCGAAYGADAANFKAVFQNADAALYRVKNRGGGGCEVA